LLMQKTFEKEAGVITNALNILKERKDKAKI